MADVIDADRDNFRDLVAEGDVLVDVWGSDCRPCLQLMPHVEQLAAERESLRVVKVEAPKARRLCMDLQVMGLPALLLFRDGEELGRLGGEETTAAGLRSWVEQMLDGNAEEES